MSGGFGPGMGALVGQKMGSMADAAEANAADLKAMREQLRNAVAGGLYDQAFTQAAADIAAEIVGELATGAVGPKRLSDPANTDGRNEAYVERAANIVRRLSDGKLTLDKATATRIKSAKHLK